MKKKDIKLFDNAIHKVKKVAAEIKTEKDKYRKQRREHDRKMKQMIKELIKVVNSLYELFADLSNGNGKGGR